MTSREEAVKQVQGDFPELGDCTSSPEVVETCDQLADAYELDQKVTSIPEVPSGRVDWASQENELGALWTGNG